MANHDHSNGLSAAWGVAAGVTGAGAITVWATAGAPDSHFPIWPAYLFGLIAAAALYMCFATLSGWWPARQLRRLASVLPRQPAVTAVATNHVASRESSAVSIEDLRSLIAEGDAMRARVADRRGPLEMVPVRLRDDVTDWEGRVSTVLAPAPALLAQFQRAVAPVSLSSALAGAAGKLDDELSQRIKVLKAIRRSIEDRN